MKVEAIVYESNTGFTKRYAEMLAEALGISAVGRKEAGKSLKKGSAVFYMGWLMAGSIKGLKKARGKYTVTGVAAVGMASPDDTSARDVVKKYQTADAPAFYLQGGIAPDKLRGIYRFMMSNVAKAMEDAQNKKAEKSEADLRSLDLVKTGGDFVNKENLDSIIAWIK